MLQIGRLMGNSTGYNSLPQAKKGIFRKSHFITLQVYDYLWN